MKTILPPESCGIAGEFYVAAELTKRGYVASLTSKNTKGIDLLASNADGTRTISIQVKTTQNKKSFTLSKKDENLKESDNLFYIFVNLNITEKYGEIIYGPVDYYVVPMRKVKSYISRSHQEWLYTPGKNGKPHNDNLMRKYDIQPDDKLNNFEIIDTALSNDDDYQFEI